MPFAETARGAAARWMRVLSLRVRSNVSECVAVCVHSAPRRDCSESVVTTEPMGWRQLHLHDRWLQPTARFGRIRFRRRRGRVRARVWRGSEELAHDRCSVIFKPRARYSGHCHTGSYSCQLEKGGPLRARSLNILCVEILHQRQALIHISVPSPRFISDGANTL